MRWRTSWPGPRRTRRRGGTGWRGCGGSGSMRRPGARARASTSRPSPVTAAALGTGRRARRKNPQDLPGNQRTALAVIAEQDKPVYKGYLIKEQLREALKVKGEDGKTLLRGVIAWAHRCRIPEFVKLTKTLSRFRDLICATLDGGPSNGRAEALNAQINALITRARGFRSATALIAMAEFVYGGLCPGSPW